MKLLPKLEAGVPSDQVYRSLVTIRCKYSVEDKHQTLLEESGLVAKLIPLLKRPNSKIVDMALSVLGNLLMNKTSRDQARENKAVEVLVRIISTLAEEKILGRACRVIANLSQDALNSREFLNLGTVPMLLKTLKEVKCPKAKASAVRAIRILAETSRQGRQVALENKAVAAVTFYLSFSPPDTELLKAVCKSLSILTTNKSKSKEMAEQIQSESDGFKKLVDLAEKHHRKSVWIPALLTLANLSRHDGLRPELGNVGAISVMASKVMSADLSSNEFVVVARALCLFSHESVNRIKLRESGALKVFVTILSSKLSQHQSVHDQIVFSLPRFGYDALSLKTLGDEGIMSCLTEIFNDYNEKFRHVHSCDEEDGMFNLMSMTSSSGSSSPAGSSSPMTSSAPSTVSEDAEMLDVTSSAAHDVSGGDMASSSDLDESSNSSEMATSTTNKLCKQIENSFSKKTNNSNSIDAGDVTATNSGGDRDVRERVIDFALQFLLRVFEIQLPSEEVTKAENVKALVRYICWTKRPNHRAGLILNRISKSMKYIKPFLLQSLFPWLRLEVGERLYGAKELTCPTCANIKAIFTSIFQEFVFQAETGYIEGTVCHALVTGSNQTGTVMTTGIVAIIMCKTLLFNILITHGGLDVLLEALEVETGQMFSHAVLSLRLLAERVNLVSAIDITPDEAAGKESINQLATANCCQYAAAQADFDFKLVMDDGVRVEANRSVLSRANGVFEAMLEGMFLEGRSSNGGGGNEVHLAMANSGSVRFLVHHLYGCRMEGETAGNGSGCCPTLRDTSDIDAWLDLVPLTDKYLLVDFNRQLVRKIMRICTHDVSKVIHAYQKSLSIVCPTYGLDLEGGGGQPMQLNTSLVTFLLVGEVHHPVRVKLFDELAKNPGLKADFIDDVSNLIVDRLKAELKKPRKHIFKSH